MIKLSKCLKCNTVLEEDINDSSYPLTRNNTSWNIGCPNPSCGISVLASSKEEAELLWNEKMEKLRTKVPQEK